MLASVSLGGTPTAHAQSAGQWSTSITLPYIPIHTTLLSSGKVLFYSYYSDSLHPQMWDPVTNDISSTATAPFELFCSGHTLLADGRVFITGGHIADYTGYPKALIFDPAANTFTSLPDMNAGRWYPTNTVLANGDVLVVSGDMTSNTTPDPLPQVFQLATNSWRNLTTAQLQMPLYPVMLLAPNGNVFNAGPSQQTRYLNTVGTGAWSTLAYMNFAGSRDYGPGVMYDVGRVLVVGGSDPPTATAETIDLGAATPAWQYTASMHYPRRQHNAVLMPDGKVFVVGGSSGAGFDNPNAPVYPTEMWNPQTGQWAVMASISAYRGYHSTALLLPDGRVISAGGNVGGPNAQIFSPPYLFAGARPTISSAPASVGYGQAAFVGTPDAANISKVTFLRLSSTTHTFDQNQRFLSLVFTQATGGLNVTFPSSANLAPPGHYMLFVLNSSGVPSAAKIVQITTAVPVDIRHGLPRRRLP
jgi:galactose oxidase